MKVLWIVNTIFPELAKDLNLKANVSGGWMYGLADQLSSLQSLELIIACPNGNGLNLERKINNKSYIVYSVNNDKELKDFWKNVKLTHKPDVVHIHGTEFSYGLNYIKANGQENVVFSIQGLVSVISRYYLANINTIHILKNITFFDIIKRANLIQQKNSFYKRGFLEKDYFKLCENVIGRTEWDYMHSYFLNKNRNYYFCNEMLREKFYEAPKWNYESTQKYSIFLSQAGYPIKGLHQVIKAITLIIDEFPDIEVRIAGNNIIDKSTLIQRLKLNGYGKYVNSLIKKHKLKKNIRFLGNLNEEQMIEEYLRANVFICPSSIENSPNSLGEAQLLGLPTISAYVGGVPDMVEHTKSGFLYRFDEVEMLAYNIKKVFEEDMKLISTQSIEIANKRNSIINITEDLISIYRKIKTTND